MPRPRNEELPGNLLAAARELLVEKGGPHFSLRELSARVGYTLTAVYRCFDDRAALLRALILQLFAELNAHCVPSLEGGLYDAVQQAADQLVSWAVEHPTEYLFMFSEYGTESLLHNDADARQARVGLEGIIFLLTAAKAAGDIDIDDPEAVALLMLTHLHGLLSMSLTGRLRGTKGEDPAAFVREHSDVLMNRVLRRSS